jgi:hypothetical protein
MPDREGVDTRLSAALPKPSLRAEWRLVLLLDGGNVEFEVLCANRREAEERGRGLRGATWRIDRRLASPWQQDGPTMRTRIVVEALDEQRDTVEQVVLEEPVAADVKAGSDNGQQPH